MNIWTISKRTLSVRWEHGDFVNVIAKRVCAHHNGSARLRVLFVCTGNSCRSQIAEGWTRALLGHVIEAHSAGIDPRGLDSSAVDVMAEAGVDISRCRSKRIDEKSLGSFDCIVTLSERARAAISLSEYSGEILHSGLPASPKSATPDPLAYYRCVRDEIRVLVLSLRLNPDATSVLQSFRGGDSDSS